MSVMEIVTGSTGIAHVTPIDDAVRNTNTGHYNDCVVFDTFSKFAAEVKTDTRIEISGGYGMIQGRYFKIAQNDKVSLEIESGRANIKRLDIICARYTLNNTIESISLVVVKGTEGTDYVAPTDLLHTTGNINEAASVYDFPLYYVYKDGIYIDHIEAQFEALPDGGRLGEIEAEFNEVKTAFHDLEAVVEGIPAEVAAAATKSYVDTEVGRISNGLSVVNNKLTEVRQGSRRIVEIPTISQVFNELYTQMSKNKVTIGFNENAQYYEINIGSALSAGTATQLSNEEYNNFYNAVGLRFEFLSGEVVETYSKLFAIAPVFMDDSFRIALYPFIGYLQNDSFNYEVKTPKYLTENCTALFRIIKVSAILPYNS